jgi:hypothetical protein
MSLAAEGVMRGDLPSKGFDIHCPLMGHGINYLATSCRSRVKNGGCSRKTCKRFTGEKILQTLSGVRVEPVPVVQEPAAPDILPPTTKTKDGKRNRRHHPTETTSVRPPESILNLDFTDEPELLQRLTRCAEQSGSTPQDEAKLFIHAYLEFLGVR